MTAFSVDVWKVVFFFLVVYCLFSAVGAVLRLNPAASLAF